MPPKPRQRRKQKEVSVHMEHSQAESAVNAQNPPPPPPSDPNPQAPPTNLLLELIQSLQQNQTELAEAIKQLKEKDAREKNPKEPRLFVRKPPYPAELLKQPYPEKYIAPTFSRFDGRKGSALVHISKFVDSMGAYAGNGDLCLREFSKSLDDRAYTWYTTLPPGSVKVWEDMVELFCGKYFQAEEKITLVNLHTTKQASGEDLLRYIHRFRDISLDCYANYEEGELVGVCIDNMLPEFRAHLENLDISRFGQLLQKARKDRHYQSSLILRKPKEKKKSTTSSYGVYHGIIKLPEAQKKATEEDKKNPKFCYFHRYVHHSTADCWTLRRKFHEKIQDGTLELPQVQQKVHTDPFLKHKDRGVVSVVIHGSTSDVGMDESATASTAMTPTAIKALQRNPRFRSLFNQLGLNPEARTAATEAIVAIAADSGAHCFTAETHASRAFLETNQCSEYTKGHIQLVLKVGPIVTFTRFPCCGLRGSLPHTIGKTLAAQTPAHPLHLPPIKRSAKQQASTSEEPATMCTRPSYPMDALFTACEGARGPIIPNKRPPEPEEGILQPSCLAVNEASVPESADAAEPVVADPKISAKEELELKRRMHLVELLKEYQDVFAWQYDEMPGIDPKLVAHSLNVEPGTRPVDYVDDIVVKSKTRGDHFGVLKKVFERCRLYKLKMNPLKCAFGVSAGKFLGFLVHQRGIDVDPARASAIATMKPPTTHKELKSFLGKLSYIRRFIPGLAAVNFYFCTTLEEGSIIPLLSQYEIIAETPTAIKSQAIADLLAQFPGEDNSFITDEVPGEINEVFLAGLADSVWTLKFDGSSTATSAGAGIVLYKDDGEAVTKSFKFDFPCSNNAAEYEAYLAGLAIAYEMGIKHLRVIGDSNLVKFEARFSTFEIEHAQRNENRYADALATLGSQIAFEGEEMDITICKKAKPITESLRERPRRSKGKAVLKSMRKLVETEGAISLYRRLQRLGYFWPNMSAEAAEIQSQCPTCQFHYSNEEEELSFEKAFMESRLDVLSPSESQMVMKETHAGECGEHQGKKKALPMLCSHLGYYWPTMKKDAADFVKTCHTCQVQANLIHTHPTSLQNMATPWPFHTWGLDLIGPINPASGGYIWILVATEYFTKWVEAIPLRKATGAAVANFIREHIITRFGIPYKLITDNGTPFINKDVREVLEHYRVKHRRSTPYYLITLKVMGKLKATNRMLLRILSKMVFDYGNDWKAHLADVLWAYRSSPKTATGFTPFSLVYGTDTISPTELVVPSPRVMQGSELETDANMCAEARMADLEGLDEARDLAKAKSQRNYQKMANVYGKALRVRIFAEGQMVLKAAEFVRRNLPSPSKFSPNWDGPYIIREAHGSGYYRLSKSDGTTLADPINGKWLKHYYS
uniref:Integrase catalytic domain-containing protein n=1 Tax=Fagus sylvatica TaxID=28930 RepID=A0A2N9HCQ8_FAGSY